MYQDITIIISAIGGIAAGGGLLFNGWSLRQQTRTQYYSILKEFQDELHSFTDLTNFSQRVKYLNFHEKIAHLANKKIISKDIATYFDFTFATALGMMEQHKENAYPNLISWCDKMNIKPENQLKT